MSIGPSGTCNPRPSRARSSKMSTYRFDLDWFSDHSHLWSERLANHVGKPDLCFVEIGSFEGRSATWLLDNVLTAPSSTLHCIDPWAYPEERFERHFDHNLALATRRGGGRMIKHKALSEEVLPTLEAGSVDFVYVDGSHTAWDTLSDIVLSWRLLPVGGFMVCDDYPLETGIAFDQGEISYPPVPPVERPKMAIDAFLQCFEGRYRLLHQGWQIWLEKTA